MSREPGLQYFVRGLIGGARATRIGERYVCPDTREATAAAVEALINSGALSGDDQSCRANAETRAWLKRAKLDADAFAAQHRDLVHTTDGLTVNRAESPLSRLGSGATPFLARHHLEAGERVRKLVERAQLQPRVTMTYSASRTTGAPLGKNDISDMAADARRAVAEIHTRLPPDCASVVIDVCGFLKGLQEVERDRGWPRRSAKLVLRIGLDQLARQYGIGAFALGPAAHRQTSWIEPGARPALDLT